MYLNIKEHPEAIRYDCIFDGVKNPEDFRIFAAHEEEGWADGYVWPAELVKINGELQVRVERRFGNVKLIRSNAAK